MCHVLATTTNPGTHTHTHTHNLLTPLYSPRAAIKRWLGDTTWFDRHDWWVDRCGTPVRYVIDFYFDESKAGSMDAFTVDARPALDGPTAALDRVKMVIYTKFAQWGLPCPITGHRRGDDNDGVAAKENPAA